MKKNKYFNVAALSLVFNQVFAVVIVIYLTLTNQESNLLDISFLLNFVLILAIAASLLIRKKELIMISYGVYMSLVTYGVITVIPKGILGVASLNFIHITYLISDLLYVLSVGLFFLGLLLLFINLVKILFPKPTIDLTTVNWKISIIIFSCYILLSTIKDFIIASAQTELFKQIEIILINLPNKITIFIFVIMMSLWIKSIAENSNEK